MPHKSLSMPSIILVSPQMGENIGAAARVMKNFGFYDLRIVTPRDGWPNPKAVDMAKKAADIIENATIYNSTADAIADLTYTIATTARSRMMEKQSFTMQNIFLHLQKHQGHRHMGILFGAERSGLTNEDVTLCDAIVEIITSKDYSSINLAQAVAIACYQYSVTTLSPLPCSSIDSDPATKSELMHLFNHLENELSATHFYKTKEIEAQMKQNIRNFLTRASLSKQEVQTLRGMIRALTKT